MGRWDTVMMLERLGLKKEDLWAAGAHHILAVSVRCGWFMWA